jgi:Outer membrane protein beta-barrel domain
MKKALLLMLLGACYQAGFAQQDSTKAKEVEIDTIRVGSIIIIKKGGGGSHDYNVQSYQSYRRKENKKNISTNWLIFDLGFAGFNDRTNYNTAEAQDFLHNSGGQPLSSGDFSYRSTRISNFNLWLFMQKLNLYKHVVNLKYGFGIENNNYFYKTSITYVEGASPFVIRDTVSFSKNKLAADFFTAPIMLNFNTTPDSRNGGLQISIGISAGYLYSARQKQNSSERGKQKNRTTFNLEPWKLAYVGELGIGPVKLYGSYAWTPIHKYGVEQYPFTVGVRFSAW